MKQRDGHYGIGLEQWSLDASNKNQTSMTVASSTDEIVIVPLGGQLTVRGDSLDSSAAELGDAGSLRAVYIPPLTGAFVSTNSRGEFAIITSTLKESDLVSLRPGVPISVFQNDIISETRGTGASHRKVDTLIGPSQDFGRVIVGETFSDGGVWSSYPPHRHDRHDPPYELSHEEVFLIRISPANGFAIMIEYSEDGDTEQSRVLHNNDIVEISSGFHSFVVADGYELYYLWAMVGDVREQLFRTDSRHGWILHE